MTYYHQQTTSMRKFLLFSAVTIVGFIWSSCKKTDSPDQTDNLSVSITADKMSLEVNQVVTFSVNTNTGVNVTTKSTIYVNGVALPAGSTSYTPPATGTINVYATYVAGNTHTSNTVQLTVNAASKINFNKRVLVEDFTGTWCGYCTRVAYGIEQVKAQTTDAVIATIHRGSDPYNFSAASVLESQIGLTGYPTAQLNRTTRWFYPEPSNVAQVVNLTTGTNPRLGLAMTSTASGNDVTLNVKVKFGDDFSNLRLVVYALEDGLVYNQTNYYTSNPIYYGGANPIIGFIHDNVLRAVLTSSILGENITGTTNTGGEYTKTFNYTVPATYQFNKMHFVAFVINSSNTTINARDAKVNENQAYEIE